MPSLARRNSTAKSSAARAPRSLVPATLVIGAGQSNVVGYALDPTNATAVTNGYAYWFYPNNIVSGTVRDGVLFPLSANKFGRNQCGPQPAFAQTWAAGGGGPVIWVDCGVGGSSLVSTAKTTLTGSGTVAISGGTWDLSDAANIYQSWCVPNVRAAIAAARDNGFAIVQIVVFWVQGEQDAGANALSNGTAYRANLNALIARFVTDFGIRCFMMSKTTGNSAPASFSSYLTDIRAAQDLVASDNPTLCPTPWETSAYFNNGWYVDTLHYTAAGYNDLGAGLATRGLAFLKPAIPLAPASQYAKVAGTFPAVAGWKRIVFRHTCSSTFSNDIYSAPLSPYAPTWIDGSGINRAQSGQSTSFSFTNNRTKDMCLYMSDTSGASVAFVGGANCSLVKIDVLDAGIKFNRFSPSSFATGFQVTNVDFQKISWQGTGCLITFYATGTTTGLSPRVSYDSGALRNLTSAAYILNNGLGAPVLDFSQPGGSNVKSLVMNYMGLSVAQVNTALQQIDANNFSSGLVNVAQFSSALGTAAAVPTGAGATAKANLLARGYIVITD